MADVFLSYARGDRDVAQRLANAIEDSGLTVWWDRHIKGGAEFSRDIERQLNEAARVLVLWSKEAVDSRWVRDEASVAADSGRLVSATIDGIPPPLGFRQFQTIDLKAWAAKGAALPAELAEALEVDAAAVPSPRTAQRPRRRTLLAAGLGALLVAGAATIAIVQPKPFDQLFGESEDQGVSLAIMPFVTEGGGDIEYLGAGLAGALADSLSPLSGLRISSSTSTQAVARQGLTAPEIGKKLGASHLIEGNINKVGDGYGISVRIIQADTSEQIWARSFEGAPDELQALKRRLARELASALRARLGVGQGEIAERRNVDPRAYEAYLRALERVSVRDERDARLEAIKQFRLAASIDPDFAEAHAGYAYLMALSMPYQLGMSWNEIWAEQRRATQRALQLDRNNLLAQIARSTAFKNFSGDADQALAIDRAVLEKAPHFGPAHYSIAASLWMQGRSREALDHINHAIERDPFDTLLRFYRIQISYSLGDYESVRDAVAQCPAPCLAAGWFQVMAMAAYGTPAQYRDDLPRMEARATAEGVPAEALAEARRIMEAFVLGRSYRPQQPANEEDVEFLDAALEARLVGFEAGLRLARRAIDRHQADNVLNVLNTGRVTFSPEQRADPRYHALFRHPKLVKIAAVRRREGVTAGLPVFPVKPYAGP